MDDIRRITELGMEAWKDEIIDVDDSVELYLKKKGYMEIGDDLMSAKVPYHVRPDKSRQAAVEWEVVLSAERGGKQFLFLVNVWSAVALVPACIERTKSFISMSAEGLLPSAGAGWSEEQSCYSWARYSGHEVRGVVFAVDEFPAHAFEVARENKFIVITASPGAVHVEDPEEIETGTCTTFLRPWWGWHPPA